jgi:predicted neuraminidase
MGLEMEWSAMAAAHPRFAMCHASTILPRPDGSVLCAFFGGSAEGAPDTGIWMCEVRDGRGGGPRLVASGSEAHWNPVLFTYPDGGIGLVYKAGNVIASWRSYVCRSDDGGRTFSKPAELVPGDRGGRGPVRNQPIVLSRGRPGRYLCPASLEDGEWRAFADISDDGMRTLRKSAEVRLSREDLARTAAPEKGIPLSAQSFAGRGVIQPALYEDGGGVHMLLRSSAGWIFKSDSKDCGETWSVPKATSIPNNNSGISCAMLGGTLYLACNPVAGNFGRRTPITLFSSSDGRKFRRELDMDGGEGEFSYPCLAAFGGALFASYTYKRRNIRIIKYKLSK